MAEYETSPGDAFARIGNETRIDILRTLADSWQEAGFDVDFAMTFSELQSAVGAEDSGRFNYHLQQLTDLFLRKTDDGYVFTREGWEIVRAIRRSEIHESREFGTRELPSACYHCGNETLLARYVNAWVWLDCPACDAHVTNVEIPPTVMERDAEGDVVATLDRVSRRRLETMADGVCPDCFADTETSIEEHRWGPDAFRRYVHTCPLCDRQFLPALGWYVVDRSFVRQFYRDRGIDLDDRPYWETGTLSNGPNEFERVLREDPWRFEVRFPAGDAELVVVLDEAASVREVSRR